MSTTQDGPAPTPAAPTPDTMTVRVRDHAAEDAAWGRGPFTPAIRTVTIDACCPRCLPSVTRRGEAYEFRQHEDGVWFSVDRWTNPCGHVDYYRSVIREADRRGEVLGGEA